MWFRFCAFLTTWVLDKRTSEGRRALEAFSKDHREGGLIDVEFG